jgi:hypothetical protein
VVDCYGVRRTIRVEAESTYRAAMAFYTRSRANPTDNLPLVGDGTVYEVKVAGDDKVYLVGSSPDVAMGQSGGGSGYPGREGSSPVIGLPRPQMPDPQTCHPSLGRQGKRQRIAYWRADNSPPTLPASTPSIY